MVQNLVICEMEKMQFVTPAEYAASEYHFTIMINAPSNPSAAKRSLNITVTLWLTECWGLTDVWYRDSNVGDVGDSLGPPPSSIDDQTSSTEVITSSNNNELDMI